MADLSVINSDVSSHRLIPIRTKLLSFDRHTPYRAAIAKRAYVCKPPRLIRSKSPQVDARLARLLNTSVLGFSAPNPNYSVHRGEKRGPYTEEVKSSVELIKNYDICKPVRLSVRSFGSVHTLAAGGVTRPPYGQDSEKMSTPMSGFNQVSEIQAESGSRIPSTSRLPIQTSNYNLADLEDIITPKNRLTNPATQKPLLLFITEDKTPRTPKEIEQDIKTQKEYKIGNGDKLSRNRDTDPQGFQRMTGARGGTFVDYLELKMMLDRKQKNGGFGQLEELIKVSHKKQAISFGEYKNLIESAKKTTRSASMILKPILSKNKRSHRAQSDGGHFFAKVGKPSHETPDAMVSPVPSPNPLKKSVTFSKYNTVFIFARDD